MSIKENILFKMVRLSVIAIVAGYVTQGLLRGDWTLERPLMLGTFIGCSYPLYQALIKNMMMRRK